MRKFPKSFDIFITIALLALNIQFHASAENLSEGEELPCVYTQWESFHKEDGLPSNKVFCVAVDEDRVWFGTNNGLALYENETWTTYSVEDGLAYPAILSIAVDHVLIYLIYLW